METKICVHWPQWFELQANLRFAQSSSMWRILWRLHRSLTYSKENTSCCEWVFPDWLHTMYQALVRIRYTFRIVYQTSPSHAFHSNSGSSCPTRCVRPSCYWNGWQMQALHSHWASHFPLELQFPSYALRLVLLSAKAKQLSITNQLQ